MTGVARWWHATVAVLVTAAVAVQFAIALKVAGAPHSVATGLLRGASAPGRIIRVLSFFTIQSNVLCGIVSAQLAVRPDRDGPLWRPLRLAALVGISVTGIVYSAVLADVHEPDGAAEHAVNSVVHYVVPAMMIVGWLLFGPRRRINRSTVLCALSFPVLWTLYTVLRGAIWHWYPYPFVDVAAHGYAVVAVNGLGVAVVVGIVALVFAAGDARLRGAPAPGRPPQHHQQ